MDVYEEKVVQTFAGGAKRVGFKGLGLEKIRAGERIDPKVQAAYNLNKTLENYDFTKEARSSLQNEFQDFPHITTVNLELLASVLNFLRDFQEPVPENFKDENITPFFNRLIPNKKMTTTERKRMNTRLKAQFLKYIIAVNAFREEDEDENE